MPLAPSVGDGHAVFLEEEDSGKEVLDDGEYLGCTNGFLQFECYLLRYGGVVVQLYLDEGSLCVRWLFDGFYLNLASVDDVESWHQGGVAGAVGAERHAANGLLDVVLGRVPIGRFLGLLGDEYYDCDARYKDGYLRPCWKVFVFSVHCIGVLMVYLVDESSGAGVYSIQVLLAEVGVGEWCCHIVLIV